MFVRRELMAKNEQQNRDTQWIASDLITDQCHDHCPVESMFVSSINNSVSNGMVNAMLCGIDYIIFTTQGTQRVHNATRTFKSSLKEFLLEKQTSLV